MKLLIPGPVTTHPDVRARMAEDYAPWDTDFRAIYARVRERVLAIALGTPDTHVALALQGCGHFASEAAVRTFVPAGQKILIPQTGTYADRMTRLATEAGRIVVTIPVAPGTRCTPDSVAAALAANPDITHVGLVISETSSGVIHDAAAIGDVVRAAGRRLILDAVSAFGAIPLDLSAQPEVDVAVFTPNKCLEGLPGMCFAVARIDRLEASVGQAGSWSLDFADIHAHFLRAGPGSSRFTPAPQTIAAFDVAMDLYDKEGGQPARLTRYFANTGVLYNGLLRIGLQPMLSTAVQGPVVLNVHAPHDPAWSLQAFVDAVKASGYIISNFYNTPEPSFRVGTIGAITVEDMAGFVAATDTTLTNLGIRNRAPAPLKNH